MVKFVSTPKAKFAIPVLYAKGYKKGVPMYLWHIGNYKYVIETAHSENYYESHVFDTSYDTAITKFKKTVGKSFEYVSMI